ncbi:hypothetical protein [Flavobacterium sp.]|uniref:hypothetical protein n=1 Tax=Flavobacterium sp. TaxID=239 RepID=UPI00261CB0DC|nr:hypothetical protein [Flavobacterium sp.]
MQPKKDNKRPIFLVVTFIMAFSLAYYVTSKVLAGGSVNKKVKAEIGALNSQCPIKVNEFTILDSIRLKDSKMVNQYLTITADIDLVKNKLSDIKKETYESTQREFETSPKMKTLREKSYSIHCYYSNKERAALFDFIIQNKNK